jgi:hypothetical protein
MATTELCFRSDFGRESELVRLRERRSRGGAAPVAMKEVLDSARYKGNERLPWLYRQPPRTCCNALYFICCFFIFLK